MILKEWKCPTCKHEFEGFAPICTQCGSLARRDFRTPVGITTGLVGKSDRLLSREFEARGISNYTNVHGTPKVTWKKGSGQHSNLGAGWGPDGLAGINKQYGTNFNVAPPGGKKSEAEVGQAVGKFNLPTQIINPKGT
jgi:hypothetical protein